VRILALEVEKQEIPADGIHAILTEEARKVWKLYQDDFIREIYFRADKTSAILMLECSDIKEAKQRLAELPLVSANLIDFELIPLAPYPGFSRLFKA
jgi:muconolactone delta-isomerase